PLERRAIEGAPPQRHPDSPPNASASPLFHGSPRPPRAAGRISPPRPPSPATITALPSPFPAIERFCQAPAPITLAPGAGLATVTKAPDAETVDAPTLVEPPPSTDSPECVKAATASPAESISTRGSPIRPSWSGPRRSRIGPKGEAPIRVLA